MPANINSETLSIIDCVKENIEYNLFSIHNFLRGLVNSELKEPLNIFVITNNVFSITDTKSSY